jgi:hypothetical protein
MWPSLHAAVRIFLSIAVLGYSFGAPAVKHAHMRGDQAHDHHASHSHHHHHLADDDQHRLSDPLGTTSTQHLHITWLGLPITLPSEDTPSKTDSSQPDSAATLCNDVSPATPAISAYFVPQVALSVWFASLPPELDPPVPRASNRALKTSIRLCDAARHERSGVQLS